MPGPFPDVEVVTFDCYGTLIDWGTGLRGVLAMLAAEHGVSTPVEQLLTDWEAIQFSMLAQYRPYRQILGESLAETFARQGVTLTAAQADLAASTLGDWPPFDDVRDALVRLKSRYRLAILSNIDDDLLALSVRRIGVPFDALITAQQVQSYKPRPAHFLQAMRHFGRPAGGFLHAAFGFKYDQRPALKLGMRTAWVKRPGWIRDDEAQPTMEVADLRELAVVLLGE